MRVLFCGAGAIGSHAALLSRNLPCTFGVLDFDRVETKNLSSQWFVKQMVGKQKSAAVKLQLLNFYGVAVQEFPVRLTTENAETIFKQFDLVVDCFDNGESRRLLQATAQGLSLPSLHAGLSADGAFGLVRWGTHFVPDDEDVPGQATCEGGQFLPLIVNVAAAVTNSLTSYLEEQKFFHWNITNTGAERL